MRCGLPVKWRNNWGVCWACRPPIGPHWLHLPGAPARHPYGDHWLQTLRPNNLPAPLTPLIDREQELARVRSLLLTEGVRLVTLLGPPGVGKTRVALAAAAASVEHFADGAFFVRLAGLEEAALVARTISQELEIKLIGSASPTAQLCTYLSQRHLLLILDDCEHVPTAVPLLVELLQRCARLSILATSRQPLRVHGEHRFPLQPLATPPEPTPVAGSAGASLAPAEFAAYPAVALFLDRAQAADPSFHLTPENSPAVGALCRRVDGLPLAIELVAAHISATTPADLVAALTGPALLAAGPLYAEVQHHRTLRDAVAWSFDRLQASDQALLARLAVFVGGWTLDAATEVCADPEISPGTASPAPHLPRSRVQDALSTLVDMSLIRRDDTANGMLRFNMLETIRQFSLERLKEVGALATAERRHIAYWVALAERADPLLRGHEQLPWLNRLAVDHDNLRAALTRALDYGDWNAALRLAAALAYFWEIHGDAAEGRAWLERALAAAQAGAAGTASTSRPTSVRTSAGECPAALTSKPIAASTLSLRPGPTGTR